jgi:GH35 family endo-1,4-beta-xylanase
MADFAREKGLVTKGHPLLWHEAVPEWLNEIPPEDVEDVLMARIRREIRDFAGLVNIWDVVNEAVVLERFKPNAVTQLSGRLGRVELLHRAFATARETSPTATLVLNDYDTTPEYERLLEQCMEKGVSFDVIGIQSHMHKGHWGPEKIRDVCDRFARFGKPLHFTEATILSGPLKTDEDWHGPHPGWDTTPEGEAMQAHQAEEFYKLLYGHPAVEAITWWDCSDHAAWQGAPAGLLRKDMSPKPAYDVLLDLIRKRWWTPEQRVVTDSLGKLRFQGHLGEYELTCDGRSALFCLDKSARISQKITL